MTPEEVSKRLKRIEHSIATSGYNDPRTKRQTRALFQYVQKLIAYQIPKPPINIGEDGHKFECARCHTKFDSEDVVDDFYLCYVCGQRWKHDEPEEEKE